MPRIVGLDPGTKRCGVAITDSQRRIAFPRPALEVNDSLVHNLAVLIDEENVDCIVVGLPRALNGNDTASTVNAQLFFEDLVAAFSDLEVLQWDERLTTKQAEFQLSQAGHKMERQRNLIDSAAAVVLLESFLEGLSRD